MDILVFFLLFASISAQCVRDLDCHLNGECFKGKCTCDRGWQGEMCQLLHLKNGSIAYGYGTTTTPKTSCWGGGPPVLGPDGQYHLLVTEIAGHCGFGTWWVSYFSLASPASIEAGLNRETILFVIHGNPFFSLRGRMSQATHSVASSIEGPYNPVNVAVPTEAHNVYYA